MTEPHLTQRELDVMSALWELGEASIHDVRKRVDPALAYTSVSTVVRTLEMKGYVAHRRGEGKTHLYYPLIDAETAGGSALSRLLEKVYDRSPLKLVAHLLEREEFSDADLARFRELLKARKRK